MGLWREREREREGLGIVTRFLLKLRAIAVISPSQLVREI